MECIGKDLHTFGPVEVLNSEQCVSSVSVLERQSSIQVHSKWLLGRRWLGAATSERGELTLKLGMHAPFVHIPRFNPM